MLRQRGMVQMAALVAAIILLGTSVSEAQGRRGRGGGGFFGRGGGGGLGLLQNEYLQKELGLTAAQKKRIREIEIQLMGSGALLREDIQKELGISDSQKAKLSKAQEEQRSKMRELFSGFRRGGGQGGRPDFSEIAKKMQKMREESSKALMSVLSSSQKAKFEKMKGKPIDREKLMQRRQRPERPRSRPDI
ncbi:MAG: hypothetical protein Tsb009_13120 [Planctomycetaceae bacterium]